MKLAIFATLFITAVSAPLGAKAITAEELIRQKQAKAMQLQRTNGERLHQLKATDGKSPNLQGAFNNMTLPQLETASGQEATPAADGEKRPGEVAAPLKEPEEVKKADSKTSTKDVKTDAKPESVEQQQLNESPGPTSNVL